MDKKLRKAKAIKAIGAYTLKNLKSLKELIEAIPVLRNPYIILRDDIKNKKRIHKQSTFGDIAEFDPNLNVCGTPMCTAGHFVQMAGEPGYKLMQQVGYAHAATIICQKAHPKFPVQDFGAYRRIG